MDAKRALLILETQEKASGNNVYSVTRPSCSSYILVHLVWIKELLLADIIGTDGLDEKNAETYFDKVGARR
jgi:hypothetical protein